MLKRINEALPGLVVSILLYGVMVELIGVWFVKDRIAYSIGVWFGIAIAVGMAINLATVIFDSVTMGDTAHATRRIVTKSILRYVVVVILFVLFGYFQWGNLIAAFLGLLGLKIGVCAGSEARRNALGGRYGRQVTYGRQKAFHIL